MPIKNDNQGSAIGSTSNINISNSDKNVKQKSARDTEYLNAVKSKDMKTAQKLVDEAAKNAGYTANRVDMTAEQRKNTRPDIDRTDVVFADGGVSYSYGVTQDEINEYVDKSKSKENDKDYKKYATVSNKLLSDVSDDIDLNGYSHALRDNDIRHILNSHGETTNEKYPVTLDDIKAIPYIIENYDKVYYRISNKGKPSLLYVKASDDNNIYYIEQAIENYNKENLLVNKQMIKTGTNDIPSIYVGTITEKQSKDDFLADLNKVRKEHAQSVNQNYSVTDSIPNSDKNVKQFSLRDSNGNTLSKQQAEYFKDSKIRDEDGNLLVVYHGTDADFTVFDKTKGRANMDIQGSFFSPWDIDAGGYGGNVRAFYLNITNPAPEGIAFKALNQFKGQNNAGIKAREYLESLGYDGVNNGDEEYIAFNSNQIKEISNTSPTSDPDIRYSLRDSYTDTQSLAKDLKKELNSSLSATELNSYLEYLVTLNADINSSEDYEMFRDTVRNYTDAFIESSNIKEEIDDSRRKELAFYLNI